MGDVFIMFSTIYLLFMQVGKVAGIPRQLFALLSARVLIPSIKSSHILAIHAWYDGFS